MTLTAQYRTALQQPDRVVDVAQEQAVELLEQLSQRLNRKPETASHRLLSRLWPFSSKDDAKPGDSRNGLYLWGEVGRGKTWLMNLFYDQLTIEQKHRVHFHHFMLDIHEQLSALSKRINPVQFVARSLAKKYRVLCIDEFIVTNITDAMLLSELLHTLFQHDVCLVATSNRVPDDLYLNGLQRDRFLPAIALITQRMHVFHLDGGVDHRSALLELDGVYYSPADEHTERQILLRMQELAVTTITEGTPIKILNRDIHTIRHSEEIIWFDFESICSAPRAAQDYIEIAKHYDTVIITGIPVMDEYSDDKTRRFIYLVDELYDRNVTLIASADTEPDQLYKGTMLRFAFQRTSSRLIEMRSHQYLSRIRKAS